jgi:response regulator RpfG family c-di-GMP phosphodiesterase
VLVKECISKPDLVIMDIRLDGGVDGIEAARRIRLDLDVPLIFLTAMEDEETVARAKILEPYGYILKPFNPPDLRIALEIALHKHKSAARRFEKRADGEYRSGFDDGVRNIVASGLFPKMKDANPALVGELGIQALSEQPEAHSSLMEKRRAEFSGYHSHSSDFRKTEDFAILQYREDGSTLWISGGARVVYNPAGEAPRYEGSIKKSGHLS